VFGVVQTRNGDTENMSDPLKYWYSKKGKLKMHCSPSKTTRWLHYPILLVEIPEHLRRFCLSCDDAKTCKFSRIDQKGRTTLLGERV
jgi:hypothetical protein